MPITTTPGYFRLGFVVLQIPPTDISTNRVINDDQISTIRTVTPMFVKSGQARWDVTVNWKAVRVVTADGTYDYSQWNDLRNIVAIFKASPFVEVENDFLRQHFTSVQSQYKTQRMAFALKQLRIDTNPDTTNVIDVVLTMTLFNYAPFSKDFGYVGGTNGQAANASGSTSYEAFIANWISENMDAKLKGSSSPPIRDWRDQEEGTITLKWRKYTYVPFKSSPPPVINAASAGYTPIVPAPTFSKRISSSKLPDDIKKLIDDIAPRHGLDPAIVEAQCLFESGGKATAVSLTGAQGLLQLLPSTARGLGVQNPLDPAQNIEGGCKYLAQQLARFGNYPHALAAYNVGAAYIYAYRDGKSQAHGTINPQGQKTPDGLPPAGIPSGENARRYVTTILTNAGRSQDLEKIPPRGTNGVAPPTPTTATALDIPDQGYLKAVTEAIQGLPQITGSTWFLDHYTELGAFFYTEESITLASIEAATEGDFDMFPNQVSVVMVNNLPVIPLAAMQYPTYQHVGPTDTIISIGMNSVGREDTHLSEPSHDGVQALASMSSQLEDQFHNLRTTFRAVSSIHRMQAVFAENQILNLLGIQGLMIRGLNTETVSEASNLAQVSLMASQYENIFEETTPFAINGVPNSYAPTLKNIVKGGQLDTVSKAEQQAYVEVKNFSDAWAAHDEAFLLKEILSISGQPMDFLKDVGAPNTNIWFADRDNLLNNLDQPTSSTINKVKSVVSSINKIKSIAPSFTNQTLQRDTYPGLQKRRLALQGTPVPLTYADYFVFSQLPVQVDPNANSVLRSKIEAQFASQKSDILEQMYTRLFDWELLTDPLFSRQSTAITHSPAFKAQFDSANTVDGPALSNPGHSCYKDLGISDYKQDPASYFIDYNEQIKQDTAKTVVDILGSANTTANSANSLPGTESKIQVEAGLEFTATGQGLPNSTPGQGVLPGAGSALVRMMQLPAYSMNTAFPTYKLMLIEEDNSGPFFAFDNFYSYASVQDIEVIKYRDQPDTAIIKITNLSHLLQHRMYDDTAAGKMEREADRFGIDPAGALVLGGPNAQSGEVGTGGGASTSGITASKTAAGIPYQKFPRKNLTEGRGETYGRIPLKFFALQTGSKIQVRLGYSNNPDSLYPVFTGQVTQIEGDDILILTCQSFQLELMNVPGTTVQKNSRFGMNFLSGGSAFGGYSLSSSGDSASVIKKMLTSPAARHFGKWEIGVQRDPLLKGFEWSEVAGEALESASNQTISKIGALLQTGYDRSGENILVNSVTNIDATQTAQSGVNSGRRTFDDETPNWFLGTARYSIPKQSELSIWDIIKDISRRYPHYNLMVRDYGFPYGADATLVYSHPLDWYYRRAPLYGEPEQEIASNVSHGQLFSQWWSSIGLSKWNTIWAKAIPGYSLNITKDIQNAQSAEISIALANAEGPMTDLAGQGPEQFRDAVQYLHGVLTGAEAPGSSPGVIRKLYDFLVAATPGNLGKAFFASVDQNFNGLYREWLAYLHTSDPATNSSRMKPVRQYHLIDHNHIVHNGITVNDQIYNAVKVKDEAPLKFNQNIPDQHTRVLNVTDMINDPDQNVLHGIGNHLLNAYAQSFLRDEVGKMYQGELIVRGVPEIEPFDVILLSDASTGMVGPIEVESVIHSFSVESGYITIIKPRLLVLANESASLGLIQTLAFAWSNARANLHDLENVFKPFSPSTSLSAKGVEVGVGASGLLAAGAAYAWIPTNGITLAVLGLVAGYGILTYVENQDLQNFFKIMPLSRFGRPWIGGLQGFTISNFAYSLGQKFRWFDAEEISPTIESWNEFLNYRADYINAGS